MAGEVVNKVRVVARVLEKLIQEVANQRRFDARSAGTLQPAGMDPLKAANIK